MWALCAYYYIDSVAILRVIMSKGTGVKYNWNLLEELFVDQGYKAIKELLKINAGQVLYAVAFLCVLS